MSRVWGLFICVLLIGCSDPKPPSKPSKPIPRPEPVSKFCSQTLKLDVTKVNCHDRKITDLKPLTGLKNIRELNLSGSGVADISPLIKLKNLTILNLDNTLVSDFFDLANIEQLEILSVRYSLFENVQLLAHLGKLKRLHVEGSLVNNLEALSQIPSFEEVTFCNDHSFDEDDISVKFTKTNCPQISVNAMAVDADGGTVGVAYSNGHALRWSIATGEITNFQTGKGQTVAVAFDTGQMFHFLRLEDISFEADLSNCKLTFTREHKTITLPFASRLNEKKKYQACSSLMWPSAKPAIYLKGKTPQLVLITEDLLLWPTNETNPRTLEGHESAISAVAVSPDNLMVASGTALDCSCDAGIQPVKIWDAKNVSLIKQLPGLDFAIRALAFGPDSKKLAMTGGYNGEIEIWTIDGKKLISLENDEPMYSLALNPTGTRLAAGGTDKIKMWDTNTGKLLWAKNAHKGEIESLSFDLVGKYLISGARDGIVRVWEMEAKGLVESFVTPDHLKIPKP